MERCDIYKWSQVTKDLHILPAKFNKTQLGLTGFPSWTSQVLVYERLESQVNPNCVLFNLATELDNAL